jgi:TPR repeat protein
MSSIDLKIETEIYLRQIRDIYEEQCLYLPESIPNDLIIIIHNIVVNKIIPEINEKTDPIILLCIGHHLFFMDDCNECRIGFCVCYKNKAFDCYQKIVDRKMMYGYIAFGHWYEYYRHKDNNINNAIKYYLMAIELGDSYSVHKIPGLFREIGDMENMLKYYLMSIDKGNTNSMRELAYYYNTINDTSLMAKYYLLAIEKGDIDAMDELGMCYEEEKDYPNMMKYYLMAIERKSDDAMISLGKYYERNKDYPNMIKYHVMAAETGSCDAMELLAIYYTEKKDAVNMIKYYLMAIQKSEYPKEITQELSYYYEYSKQLSVKKEGLDIFMNLHKNGNIFAIQCLLKILRSGRDKKESCREYECNDLVEYFVNSKAELEIENTKLKKEIEEKDNIITELQHMPGGIEYMKVKTSFEKLAKDGKIE